jgi:hypothetical protein
MNGNISHMPIMTYSQETVQSKGETKIKKRIHVKIWALTIEKHPKIVMIYSFSPIKMKSHQIPASCPDKHFFDHNITQGNTKYKFIPP